eukprot:g20309.t1
MLRRNARLRKEYLYKKALEDREATTFDKKRKLQEALDKNKAIPTELKGEDKKLRKTLDLADDRTKEQRKAIDDEYAFLGVKDPKVLLTTSRDPSSRLSQFLKELRMLFPGAQRMNRAEKPPTMSEANPHLIFHGFTAKTGLRLKTILQALFPPAKQAGDRVMTFANRRDVIHFRHHNFVRPKGRPGDGHPSRANHVTLTENGPRFAMRLFRLELGAIDMKDVEVEWVLRPYFNRQKEALALPEDLAMAV